MTEHKMCFDFLYNFRLKHFPSQEEFSQILSQTQECLHVKYPSFLSDFNEPRFCSTEFLRKLKYEI